MKSVDITAVIDNQSQQACPVDEEQMRKHVEVLKYFMMLETDTQVQAALDRARETTKESFVTRLIRIFWAWI